MINPNSNEVVTGGLDEALDPFKTAGVAIECMTLSNGPFGIEKQADIEAVTLPLRDLVQERGDVDCFVIACYSDPGIHVCREATDTTVLGIQECGVLAALARGEKFGVIAIQEASIRRHLRYLRQMDVMARLAAERAANLTVAQSASGNETFGRLIEVGRDLRDNDGADTIILGCAGMASHRAGLEAELGVPVIDPVQAAVASALGIVLLL
ncbi:MAG: Asp/Glu racemase [Hyphomicrobiales bacterium]|nr:Asp/Glu racemase [Hyphomicrobiales bacterium]MCP4997251.1 Asp/Glu racemase [Hyphomicrobiales bacterium]